MTQSADPAPFALATLVAPNRERAFRERFAGSAIPHSLVQSVGCALRWATCAETLFLMADQVREARAAIALLLPDAPALRDYDALARYLDALGARWPLP